MPCGVSSARVKRVATAEPDLQSGSKMKDGTGRDDAVLCTAPSIAEGERFGRRLAAGVEGRQLAGLI